QHRGGRGRLAEADRLHVGLDELDGVVDGGQRRERTTRGIDVDRDVAVGVHRLQAQQLRHHRVGDVVADRGSEEGDAVLEELGVGVDPADAVRRALFPLRDVVVHAQASLSGWAGRPWPEVSRAEVMSWSMRPYSSACCGVNQRSRSESRSISATSRPVWKAISSPSCFFSSRLCSAWILMSEAEPPMPPEGWCIMIRACGRA